MEEKVKNKKKFYIETYGCQMNEFDSERISFLLKGKYEKTTDIHEADIIIFNTCSVRKKAENKLYGHIGALKQIKMKNPGIIICIGGCAAQNLKGKIQRDFPYVDIVFGTSNASRINDLIEERYSDRNNICQTEYQNESFNYFYGFNRSLKFKAFLPVMIGCNNFCSYCIVPYVRGRERSIPHKIILENIKKLVKDGVIEITLLGQNVNSYGNDIPDNNYNFSSLLNDIAKINGLERVRFMTSHPKDFSLELINVIKKNKNIMKHIHLPLQAGSDKILKLMNRKYTVKQYINLYNNIKKELPDCSITTDIIVGFPGEQEVDFFCTLDTVKKLRFTRAYTFIFSQRKGTKAENFKDKVDPAKKKEWFNLLLETQNRISLEENSGLIGKNYKVLVEGNASKKNGLLEGRLENNTLVNFNGENKLVGKLIDLKITGAASFYLKGEQVF